MPKFKLKALIEKTVRSELNVLLERKTKQWQAGDKVSSKILNRTFKAFHFSRDFRGNPTKLTPRVPQDPWMNDEGHVIEDDFSSRVSLGPTIEKAQQAIEGENRAYLYAGDVRKDPSDDFETLETDKQIKFCPSSEANDYGPNFSITDWIDELFDEDLIDGETTEDIMDAMEDSGHGDFGPKDLPGSLQLDFTGCVPDARDTKELWSLKPVQMFHVAYNKKGDLELTSHGAEILNRLMERFRKDAKARKTK